MIDKQPSVGKNLGVLIIIFPP